MSDLRFLEKPTQKVIQEAIAARCPQFAGNDLVQVMSGGTDNAMYRLGDNLALRIPLHTHAVDALRKEVALSQLLKSGCLMMPEFVELEDGSNSPFAWAIYNWIEGGDHYIQPSGDLHRMAKDLAEFVLALRSSPANHTYLCGKQNHDRGVPLDQIDAVVRHSIEIISDEFDANALLDIWNGSLAASQHEGEPVWLHGDLHAGNLVTNNGELVGVIDFGLAGMGDPAADLPSAWWLFTGEARQHFKETMNVDEAQWRRGRGWALHNAVIAYAYYRDKDKVQLNAMARAALSNLIEEQG